MDYCKRLKELRVRNGYTQEQVAFILHTRQEQYSKYENGKRELLEETGYIAEEYTFLGEFYPSCGYTEEIIYLYLAKKLTYSAQKLDEDEFVKVKKIPLEEAFRMVMENKIPDGKTQAAVMKTYWNVTGGKSDE